MNIQPGVGYTFTSSSQGTNINIEQPWSQWDSTGAAVQAMTQQFQLRSVRIGTTNKLQMAKGTVAFTQSNMPRVRLGGHYDQRQTWISKVAVYGSGVSRVAGTGSPVWMEAGGYYNITTAGTYYVTVSKFDINQSNDDTESALLNAEAPWVSIFPVGDPIESAIFSETGPSEYVNKTNMQKMVGYDAMSTGLSGDWGNCHTTWFNPVKWGYSVKLIATVTASAAPVGGGMVFAIDQHIVGPIDLQIPVLFIGTTLCNQDDLTETNDPYNQNKDSDPAWSFIVNADTLTALNEITPANDDWYQEFVGPADWTSINYIGLTAGSCAAQDDGEVCIHPFYTYPRILKPDPTDPATFLYRANVCGGMVNNLIPWNNDGLLASRVKLPTSIDFLPLLGTVHIYIRLGTEAYESSNPVFPVTDDTDEYYPVLVQYPANTPEEIEALPVDTDEYCYMLMAVARNVGDPENFIIDQMVSGSLWVDRIKTGASTARYYWARV
jgi:DNA-binding Lrp family transcriptional regulator